MKKFITVILAVLAFAGIIAFAGCNKGGEEKTVSGTGTLIWHINEEFTAEAEVTVKDNVITDITVNPESYVTTGMKYTMGNKTYEWTEEVQSKYLSQYIGLNVSQILAMDVRQPADPTDHYDGGSLTSDDVTVVTGATASSVVLAMAIRNAVAQIAEN